MSHRLISHLRSVRDEYDAARAALALTYNQWPSVHDRPELVGATFRALQLAVRNAEATYTARLFAEFEAILRRQYSRSRSGRAVPDSNGLINGLGRHYKIPAAYRERVHRVRKFRHSVAHADPGAEPVPLVDALSWLNQYLSFIPDADVA